jgi:hypothetical protein
MTTISKESEIYSIAADVRKLHIKISDCPDKNGNLVIPPWLFELFKHIHSHANIECINFIPNIEKCTSVMRPGGIFDMFKIRVNFRARDYKSITFSSIHIAMVNKLLNAFQESTCKTLKICLRDSAKSEMYMWQETSGMISPFRVHLRNINDSTVGHAEMILKHHRYPITQLKLSRISTNLDFCYVKNNKAPKSHQIRGLHLCVETLEDAGNLLSNVVPEKWPDLNVIVVETDKIARDITKEMHLYVTMWRVLFEKFKKYKLDMFILQAGKKRPDDIVVNMYTYLGSDTHILMNVSNNLMSQFSGLEHYLTEGIIAPFFTDDIKIHRDKIKKMLDNKKVETNFFMNYE